MDCKTAQKKIMPYIEHKLNDRDTEDFIDHIRECKACSEELEVYFTIYYALETLDDEDKGAYDIQELLEQDLKQREDQVKGHNIMNFYRHLFMALMGVLAAILLITAAQIAIRGSFEQTTLYNLFANDTEPAQTTRFLATDGSDDMTEEAEPQTNRKRQPIVTTPETEPPVSVEAVPINQ